MRTELGWLAGITGAALLVTVALVLGAVSVGGLLVIASGAWIVLRIAASVSTEADKAWLSTLLLVAYLVKVVSSIGRLFMVTDVYEGGDSLRYHLAATEMVHEWRALDVPEATVGSESTQFTEQLTAFLYIPGVPSLLVSFLFFSFFAFIGLICFYLAFRRSVPAALLKPYAISLFFVPSLLFWPSSIGKDSVMVFAIGLISLGAVCLFERRWGRGLLIATPGLLLALGVRAHVVALLAAAIAVALAGARHSKVHLGPLARGLVVAGAAGAVLYFGLTAAVNLGLETSSDGLDDFLARTEERTAQGGSALEGGPVRSPLDLPEALLRVLFRPLPGESLQPALLLASIEGGLLLAFTLLRLPRIVANFGLIRTNPYLLFATVYCLGFAVAFSSIFNLGILARQRVQVLPLLLVVLIGLGSEHYRPGLDQPRVDDSDTQPTRA